MIDAEMSTADLVRLLYNADKSVRNSAAIELGNRGAEGFAAALPLLSDESWVNRAGQPRGRGICSSTPALIRRIMGCPLSCM